jgi:hypothetical protein
VDPRKGRSEEELRREAALSRAAGSSIGAPEAGAHRVERVSQDATRQAARRGTREALEEKEQGAAGVSTAAR